MKVLTFQVPGDPVAKGRHRIQRVGRKCPACGLGPKIHTFTPDKTTTFEDTVALHAKVAARLARIRMPIEIPLICRLIFVFACGSTGRWVMDRKPDGSNVVKAIEDGLVRGKVIHDDALIVELHVLKLFGSYPITSVELEAYQGAGRPECLRNLELRKI